MPEPKRLVVTLWIACSLALLVCALSARGLASAAGLVASRPDETEPDLAVPAGHDPIQLDAPVAVPRMVREKALCSESEEQEEAEARDEPGVSSSLPGSPYRSAHRGSVAPPPVRSHHPLRC